jgi:hypothetical protein
MPRIGEFTVYVPTVELKVKCIGGCKKDYSIIVNQDDFEEWRKGKLAQDAFPYLSAGERELLITAFCGDCFDNLMKGSN